MDEMIRTIADTIIWVAQKRLKQGKYTNINAAIHSVKMEITNLLMDMMADNDRRAE